MTNIQKSHTLFKIVNDLVVLKQPFEPGSMAGLTYLDV